jgi:hypothetical protein
VGVEVAGGVIGDVLPSWPWLTVHARSRNRASNLWVYRLYDV